LIKVAILGYLLGAIPFGYLVGKWYKIDIREYGSGNIGFTNVLRVLGTKPAAIVIVLDALKGYLATWYGFTSGGELLAIIGALGAMAGHSWPFILKFKGGRGVATGFGIIIFLSYKITLVALFIWLLIVYFFRYVSLGSIIAAFFVPIAMLVTNKPLPYIIFSFIGASLVIIRHSSNMKRLLNGTENKFGIKVNTPKGGEK
jgi:glycerol-3-phosphate acyltransferase PlsY